MIFMKSIALINATAKVPFFKRPNKKRDKKINSHPFKNCKVHKMLNQKNIMKKEVHFCAKRVRGTAFKHSNYSNFNRLIFSQFEIRIFDTAMQLKFNNKRFMKGRK